MTKRKKSIKPDKSAVGSRNLQPATPGKFNFSHYFLFCLILLVLFACYNIIKPYLHSILLAMILSAVFNPVHAGIVTLVKGRENLGAFLSCLLLTLVVVLPLILVSFALIRQGVQSFAGIQEWIAQGGISKLTEHPYVLIFIKRIETLLPDVQKVLPDIDPQKLKLDQVLLQAATSAGKTLMSQGGHLAGNMASFSGKFFLMIFTFFFMVRDEKQIISRILHLIPLNSRQENEIMEKIKSVARSALFGTFATSVAQGLAGGIAFWIAGLPGLFWGTVMAFASLVPLVGTALVWVPAAIYLFVSGKPALGIFMVLWCVLIVGSIDNFLRPLFMQGSSEMSTPVIFFSIIGGMNYFGLIGLLYGPLIFALAIVLLYIYNIEFELFLNYQDTVK